MAAFCLLTPLRRVVPNLQSAPFTCAPRPDGDGEFFGSRLIVRPSSLPLVVFGHEREAVATRG